MFLQSLWELHALFSEGVYKPLEELTFESGCGVATQVNAAMEICKVKPVKPHVNVGIRKLLSSLGGCMSPCIIISNPVMHRDDSDL